MPIYIIHSRRCGQSGQSRKKTYRRGETRKAIPVLNLWSRYEFRDRGLIPASAKLCSFDLGQANLRHTHDRLLLD